jgi:hypothetical protein
LSPRFTASFKSLLARDFGIKIIGLNNRGEEGTGLSSSGKFSSQFYCVSSSFPSSSPVIFVVMVIFVDEESMTDHPLLLH